MPQPPALTTASPGSASAMRLGVRRRGRGGAPGARLAVAGQRPHGHRDTATPIPMDDVAPCGHGSERERLLAEGVAVQGDQRVAALEDERVHDVAHRRAAGVLERVPQVAGHGVAVGVRLEIGPHAVAEHLGARCAARACAGRRSPSRRSARRTCPRPPWAARPGTRSGGSGAGRRRPGPPRGRARSRPSGPTTGGRRRRRASP